MRLCSGLRSVKLRRPKLFHDTKKGGLGICPSRLLRFSDFSRLAVITTMGDVVDIAPAQAEVVKLAVGQRRQRFARDARVVPNCETCHQIGRAHV